jgi:pimeloyl-ACP methyl ester carboxylesterase
MDVTSVPPPRVPPPWKMAIESRAAIDGARLALLAPRLARGPRGDGRPVIVLPGYGTSDASTILVRGYLTRLGYDVRGWGLGRNHGRVLELLPEVEGLVEGVVKHHGPVALVGWSLGGVLARETARALPGPVRRVVTMGTPVIGGPKYTQTARAYAERGLDVDEIERLVAERERAPIGVPVTAIYSRNDGVVDWRACIDRNHPEVEHVEVRSSHLGMGACPDVYAILADRLARR